MRWRKLGPTDMWVPLFLSMYYLTDMWAHIFYFIFKIVKFHFIYAISYED